MYTAEELHERAKEATNAGRHAAARTLARRALAGPCDPELRALLTGTLAHAEAELGNLDEAESLCTQALATRGLSAKTVGIVLGQRAIIALRRGRRAAALSDFSRAIELLAGEPQYEGRMLLNRGNLRLDHGEAAAAARDFTAAIERFHAAGLTVQEAKAQHNLGYARMLTGDLVGALQLMTQAAQVLGNLSTISRAVGRQDRAEALLAAGLSSEGLELLRSSVRLLGHTRARAVHAAAAFTLARNLVTVDPQEAARVAKTAAHRFAAMGALTSQLRATAVVVACDLGRGRSSVAEATALVPVLRAHRLAAEADLVTIQLVRYLVARGRLDEAAAVRLPSPASLSLRLLADQVSAERSVARGRPSQALRRIRRGLHELQGWQASFGSLDLQTSVSQRAIGLSRYGLQLAVQAGRPADVYEWSERARALAARIVAIRPPPNPVTSELLAELRHLSAVQPQGGTPEWQRLQSLRAAVRERAWQERGSARFDEVARLSDVQAQLAATDACLVAHLIVGDRLAALLVGADRLRLVDLGRADDVTGLLGGLPADLDLAAGDLPQALHEAVLATLHARLRRLDEALLAPLRPLLAERRLVLTPSAELSIVPWTLLDSTRGRPVTIPRSATTWLRAGTRPWHFDVPAGFVAGPGLRRADAEVAAAAEAWTSPVGRGSGKQSAERATAVVLVAAEATVDAVVAVAGHVGLLHLATHGQHVGENPLFSSLLLADGPLFCYDLDRLERLPALVVLSACDVGRVAPRPGEESLGMTTAWLHAGARAVLAATGALPDAAACAFMPTFYRAVRAGAAPSDALADCLASAAQPLPLVVRGTGW